MGSPAPCCALLPANISRRCGNAQPIRAAPFLPAGCEQSTRRNNSLGTCSQSISSQQCSPCVCPGLSPLGARVRGVKHKPGAACCQGGRRGGRRGAAQGDGAFPRSHQPKDAVGIFPPISLPAGPGWALHQGYFSRSAAGSRVESPRELWLSRWRSRLPAAGSGGARCAPPSPSSTRLPWRPSRPQNLAESCSPRG